MNFIQTLFLAVQAAIHGQHFQEPIRLDSALVTGNVNGTVIKYLGIPYAQASRFNLPRPITSYNGIINAVDYGPGCIQQKMVIPQGVPLPISKIEESEDCLSINIVKPVRTNCTVNSKLPVVVWIYGGGFQSGSSSIYDEMGKEVVLRSVELEKPVIFVSMNYRVSAYGFLASQEVTNEGIGNFGLYDQRLALHWIKRHISAFGGDHSKVTLWGQSAGAMSAALHMTAYGGRCDGLFQGVFMQSGAPIPVGPIQNGQKYYDTLVSETNCTGSTYNTTLECLRHVPLEDLRTAVDKSPNFLDYQAVAVPWLPRVDGDFIQDEPYKLVKQGKFVDVPTVSGTCDDEGTFFSVAGPKNISTDADFKHYVRTFWAPGATDEEFLPLWSHYTAIPSQGSPFGRPNLDAPYKQYTRLSAFQGDILFHSPRRLFTEALSRKTQKAWVYLSKRFKMTPLLGSYHGSDLANFTQIYVINFANSLDPNIKNGTVWPPYSTAGSELPQILTFLDPEEVAVAKDDYRIKPIEYLSQLTFNHPL